MSDYLLYIILRAVIFVLRFLPLSLRLSLGSGMGWIYYYLAGAKNRKAYANLKVAFGYKSRRELKNIIHRMYQRYGQNLMEALYIPFINESYIKKYIRVSGISHVEEAQGARQGILFMGCHAGSWELSNIACAMLFSAKGGPACGGKEIRYAVLAKPQSRHGRLDAFLNGIREAKGNHVIRVDELKKMVEHLSNGNMLGIVADHGGKDGIPIEFFGKLAMTPTGSLKLAKKFGSKIILAFMHRVKGPCHEMILRPYELVLTGDATRDIEMNLSKINLIFQEWIAQYPEEYLWFYKRWKYSPQKNILILSDGKAGHFKQSLALADMVLRLGFKVKSEVCEIRYKSERHKKMFTLASLFFGPGLSLWYLPFCLDKNTYDKLTRSPFDLVISAGASLAAVNLAVAKENNARAIAIMKPGILDYGRFDLVIMPEHDQPALRKNILITRGSLNMINAESIKRDFQGLSSTISQISGWDTSAKPKVGLLIGGDSKNYKLMPDMMAFLCRQLAKALEELDGYLFLTTSRRTPKDITDILKSSFKDNPRCKLFVDAAENNPQGTVGGIFYLSDVVIVSGESISMVSEAVASGKYVVVFEPRCEVADNKARRFLNSLALKNYIYLVKLNDIYDKLIWAIKTKPPHSTLATGEAVKNALKRIL